MNNNQYYTTNINPENPKSILKIVFLLTINLVWSDPPVILNSTSVNPALENIIQNVESKYLGTLIAIETGT